MKLGTLLLQIRVLLRQNLEGNSRAGGSSRAGYGHTHKRGRERAEGSFGKKPINLPNARISYRKHLCVSFYLDLLASGSQCWEGRPLFSGRKYRKFRWDPEAGAY